jgi:hypothetical protein
MNRLMVILLVGSALGGAPLRASAQYYPGYRPPARPGYPGGYVNPYFPQGSPGYNRLNGQADVMRAQGDLTNANEQARIAREKANQAKIDTKRKAFDEMLYENANTPTYLESLTKDQANKLTRLMNHPLKAEINDGRTLNVMLPLLQTLTNSGSQGPPVTLPKFAVNALKMTIGGQPSVGMLANKGPLEWTSALRGPQQKKLDKLLPAAVEAAVEGTLSTKMLKEIRTEMTSLRESIRKQFQKDEIEGSSYFRAIEYYNSLEASIKALDRPDAKKQLTGAYAPKATNVQELVQFATDNGLQFAAAAPGDENAYKVVHDSCVRYARTAQASGGFTSSRQPAMPGGKKE